jgi:vitamin B12 transporter
MRAWYLAAVAACTFAGTAAAQGFPAGRAAEARAAVEACAEAGERNDEAAARPAAERAATLLRAWLQAEPQAVEPRVRLAAVRVRCEIPFAEMMAAGALVGQANALLEEALRIDSTHWEARFSLAVNHFHTPEFLGRTPDAIRHLEILLRQQGDRAEPHHALTHLYLGDLYRRTGREADAASAWRRGAALHPGDPRFAERLGGGGGAAVPFVLPPLVVEGGNRLDDARSATSLRRVDVLTTPGGTADVMQAFQTAPGATRAEEGSDLYVRGGDPAETPVFVDGARLIYPGRYETLNGAAFGVLDAQVLRSAYFSSGGFSARYGDALSGVLDVATVGRPAARGARLNANTVQVGTTAELPLSPRAGAWLSARGTHGGLMLAMHGRSDEFERAPAALEAIAGLVWSPRAGTEVKAITMADEDGVARVVEAHGWEGAFRSRGSNRLAALSARTLLAGDRLAVRGSVSGSERVSRFRFGVLDRERNDAGVTARGDADLSLPGGGRLSGGVEASWMEGTTSGTVPAADRLAPGSPATVLSGTAEEARHVGAYVEHERTLGPSLAVIAGVRGDLLPGEEAPTVDPRVAVAYRAGAWTLRAGGGVFHQGRWRRRYAVPDAGSPSGTPTRAEHLVAGAERGGEPALRVEGYTKGYGAYAASGEGPAIVGGRANGIDAMVRWTRQRRLNGWITYGFLDGRVRLEDGSDVPSAVDVTHSLTGVGRLMVWPGWELGGTLRLGSGRPFTPISGADAERRPVYGAPHGARLPAYSRLDGRITRYVPTRGGVGVLYVEGLNLLDRRNVSGYTYAAGYAERRPVLSYFSERTLVLGLGVGF